MTHGSTCVQFNKYTFIANQLEKKIRQTERRENKNEILNAALLCDVCIFFHSLDFMFARKLPIVFNLLK